MKRTAGVATVGLFAVALAVSACAPAPDARGDNQVVVADARSDEAQQAAPVSAAAGAAPQSPRSDSKQDPGPVVVYKNANCGCCGLWVDHMRAAGFTVDVRDVEDLGTIKESVGVPAGMASCHTAQVGGYFVEGHVPAADIKRLLEEKPDAKGLVLPGMPLGSPGMETPDGRVQPYVVELVRRDGSTATFAQH